MQKGVVAILIGLSAFAAQCLADDGTEDLKKLAGTWQLVRGWSSGRSMAEILDSKGVEISEFRIVVSGDSLAMHGGPTKPFIYSIKLHANQTPRGIDLTPTQMPGRRDVSFTAKAIYQLNGDELEICLPSGEDADRPTEFDAPES